MLANKPWKPYIVRSLFGRFQHIRGVPRLLYLTRRVVFSKYEQFETLRSPNGHIITIDRDDYGHVMQFYFTYSPEILSLLPDILSTGDVCIDLGANIGLLTSAMAQIVGETGRVIAVEPNAHLTKLLDISAKEIGLANIVVVEAGVAGFNGEAYFSQRSAKSDAGEVLVQGENVGARVKVYTVKRLTDEFIPVDKSIAFIKVDIEGLESQLIDALHDLFEHGERPMLLVEFHPNKLQLMRTNPEDIRFSLKNDYGYEERHLRELEGRYSLEYDPNPLVTRENILFVQPYHLERRKALQEAWLSASSGK